MGFNIKRFLSKIFEGEFNRNVLTLVSGTAVAQIIPILATPLLTRLYTPADFGILALFLSIVSIVAAVSCGRYELSIILPEKDDDAVNLAAVAFVFNLFITLSFLLFLYFFKDWFLRMIRAETLNVWIYLAPLVVFLVGFSGILNYTNNRFKFYKDIALSKVYKSIAMVVVQLSLGVLKFGYIGLILGYVIAQFFANWKLFKNIYRKGLCEKIQIKKMKYLAKRYIKFPIISTWSALMNTLGYQILNILVGIFFGSSVLGQFYLAYRILGMPVSLISSSFAQVFYQQANEEKIKTGKIINTFRKTFKQLVFVSLIIFVPIFFTVKPAFVLIFGEKWKDAGLYAMILTPMFAIRFVSSVFTMVPIVFEKQHIDYFFQLGILLLIVISFLLAFNCSFLKLISLFSLLLSLYYAGYIYFNKRLANYSC